MSAPQERKNLPNYYLALDILPGASHNDILHAYNRSKKTYSAGSLASYGLVEGASAKSILDEIEDAFEVLGNPSRRREYDMKMGFETWTEDESASGRSALSADGLPSVITTPRMEEPTPARETPMAAASAQSARQTVVPFASATPKPAPARATPMVSPDFEPNPEFESKIASCEAIDGAFLKAVRIYRRLSVDQLAERCKLSSSHISAVEDEDGSRFPQTVYLRGHVYLIGQALELPNPGGLAVTFIQKMKDQSKLAKGPF